MDWMIQLERYCSDNGIRWERDAVLAEYCTFRIGGRCDLLAAPADERSVAGLMATARSLGVPALVLGRGSNMLFSDSGFRGLVIHIGPAFAGIRLLGEDRIDCDCGASLLQLCRFAWENGLSGLEFAYGIPGSVGGAIYMNAGAYGGEIKDVLVSARHIGPDGNAGALDGGELGFSYRHSAYTDGERVITGGVFRLRPDDKAAIRARMDDYMQRRSSKQPLDYPSAGSTFKRPEGAYASALIDQCGLKGARVGGAMVSEKHAGFVINAGGATCADVRALIHMVQQAVREQTGFSLACEVKIIE